MTGGYGAFDAAQSSRNPNIAIATVAARSSGSYTLDGSTLTTPTNGVHTLNVNASTGNLASASGILLVTGGKNEDNYALSKANTADGSFAIYGHDNGADGGSYEQDGVAFVYIPANAAGITSGRVNGAGTTITLVSGVGSNDAGTATVSLAATGSVLLKIDGVTDPNQGVLIISAEGGTGNNVDNIASYEWSPTDVGYIVQSRDLPGGGLQNQAAAGADIFSFAYTPAPVLEPNSILAVSALGAAAFYIVRRKLRNRTRA